MNFDCPECIKIELGYLVYTYTQDPEHSTIKIAFDGCIATVNFITNLMTFKRNECQQPQEFRVKRSESGERRRPDTRHRHDPEIGGIVSDGQNQTSTFIFSTNLEWLSLNWRKWRAEQISTSIAQLILNMFDNDFEYFPTLKEIRDGLIGSQLNFLNQ